MGLDIVTICLAALLTILSAVFGFLYKKQILDDQKEIVRIREKADKITKEAAETYYTRALDLMARKISDGVDLQEIEERLEPLLQSIKLIPDNIPEFSEIVKQQTLKRANIQFWYSLIIATLLLFIALYLLARSSGTTAFEHVIQFLPGFTSTVIAGLFFRQANQNYQFLKQISSTEFVKLIKSEQLRDSTNAKLAMIMAGMDMKEVELKQPFQSVKPEDEHQQK